MLRRAKAISSCSPWAQRPICPSLQQPHLTTAANTQQPDQDLQELTDEDLDQVSGGVSFDPRNEWECWGVLQVMKDGKLLEFTRREFG
jgi:bacteriocin-like protein